MPERFAQQDEWPGPGALIIAAETKCGVWNTVVILAGSIIVGVLIGLVVWKFWNA